VKCQSVGNHHVSIEKEPCDPCAQQSCGNGENQSLSQHGNDEGSGAKAFAAATRWQSLYLATVVIYPDRSPITDCRRGR
jgi:hypothetical protein